MKKILITAAAVFALSAPFASAQYGNNQGQHQNQGQYQGQGHDGDQAHRDDQHREQGHDNDQMRRDDNYDQHRDRYGRRTNWRDTRSNAHWDERQHNGYYSSNRWHYGPPPPNVRGHVVYGYRRWSTGQRLGYYRDRYREVDFREHHLRPPRRGYHWVEDDDGDFLLVAIATGVIASVILSHH